MSLSILTDSPETQPPITHNSAWDEAIKRAALELVNSPDFVPESGRLRAAIAFVRAGAVRLLSDGSTEVMSDTITYVLNPDCKCADAEHRGPQCKHFLAVQVMRRALEIHWDLHGPAAGSASFSSLPAPERPRRMVDEHPWTQSEPPLLYLRLGKFIRVCTHGAPHLRRHQQLQHVVTRFAFRAIAWTQSAQGTPDFPADRPARLAAGDVPLGTRVSRRLRRDRRGTLDERRRDTTPPAVAYDRFLLASLRGFHPAPLLGTRMQDLDVSDRIPP